MSKDKILPSLNLVVLLGAIFLSYYSNTGAMNGNTMGSLSNQYDNLFTPAGYAFSIWGFIYIGLLGNAIYLIRNSGKDYVNTQSKWLTIANFGNCAWVFLWLYEFTALSTLAMAIILFSLFKLTVSIQIGFQKHSLWVWWPISIYAGWIIVALVANITAYLSKIGWKGSFSEITWAVAILAIAFLIYLFLLLKRRLSYATYVGVWAFAAIAIKQWGEVDVIGWSATVLAALLFVLTVWKDFQIRMALKESHS